MGSHSEPARSAPRRIIDVECWFCKAQPGEPCLTVGKRPKSYPHMKRVEAYHATQQSTLPMVPPDTSYLDDVLALYMPRHLITPPLRKKAQKLGHIDRGKLGIGPSDKKFEPTDMDLFRDALSEP